MILDDPQRPPTTLERVLMMNTSFPSGSSNGPHAKGAKLSGSGPSRGTLADDEKLTHSERLKIDFAPVVNALYRDMTRFATPGTRNGVAELAVLLDRSENALRHQFGPTSYDHAPATAEFLRMIETLKSKATVIAIAALADCVAIPMAPKLRPFDAGDSDLVALQKLTRLAASELHLTIRALEDKGRLTAAEREQARAGLLTLITYAADALARLE